MKKYLLTSILFFSLLLLMSCSSEEKEPVTVKVGNIKGLVEKGPFVSGASVSVYELDENLKATGRVFETKTNDEGAFSINPSTALVSKYVKLSVNGFYFNEYTGKLSDAPVSLEAITSIEDVNSANVNVNILTHLEMPRVVNLVSGGTSFQAAKQQAQAELLKAFLITDKTLTPETASITGNNTSANILIAISSILLNERSDAAFTEFMSKLRNDLTDGQVSEETKKAIASSSLGLSYSRIKENIKKRYEELGKTVEVGNFELFIDGDGDGQIGDSYEEDVPNIFEPEDIFNSEENVKNFCASLAIDEYKFLQNQYLVEGLYANTVNAEKLNRYYDLKQIYDHNLTANMPMIYDLWSSAYRSVTRANVLTSAESKHDWFKKYQYLAKAYRAYLYLGMTDMWGNIPLVTGYNSGVWQDAISSTSKNEILEFVISELESVYAHLPESSSGFECSKYFAKAIQARAYLNKKNYSKALECLNIIVNSGKYSLESNVNAIYAGGSKEMIFELPNADDYSSLPYRELVQKGNNLAVCRYAEVLLMAAEANIGLGNTNQALKYLNQVRKRNGGDQIDGSSNVQSALLNEWKKDLGNEGLYFSVLKRMDKAKEILNIEDYKLLYPIPQRELDMIPNMKQNPGY